MFSIIIKDFQVDTIIGVLAKERKAPQRVIINAQVDYEYEGEYLDYAAVSGTIRDILQARKFEILEDGLEYICSYLKNEYLNITQITLEILKPEILEDIIVGAKITKRYE
ncbi:MAG: FolB domain-containing protein [Epsilonproteobacteria bacterium]|nr:FolB domain-containing protein [Campylobacterota bacterium]